ncbi:amidohydrolase [Microbacterium gorillae]|uniref:amidohydrolase n=1 Tax=Microbacterium gorillae TaxID=1231063 RepID=UPI00058D8E42|nr:amidohydrolase family protein [Microbacterium gorillae]
MEPSTLITGRVLSLAAGLSQDQALAVTGTDIAAVGSTEAARSVLGSPARVLDAGRRTVMPGFIDSHSHAAATAIDSATMVDCVNCHSIEQMQQILSENLHRAADTGWLIARGQFLLNLRWTERRYPDRHDLDKVSTTIPIAFRAGHKAVLNTKALEVVDIERYAGVTHGAAGPASIEREADGRPSGRINNLDPLLPLPEPTAAEVDAAIRNGVRNLFTAKGVTTTCEITDSRASLQTLADMVDDGTAGTRFKLLLWVPRTYTLDEALDWRAQGLTERAGMFDVHGIKMFADGGYTSSDAATEVPYTAAVASEPGSMGVLSFSDDELAELLDRLGTAGVELAMHANGERSQEQLARVLENFTGTAPKLRLEHAANWVWNAQTPDRWRRANAAPVPNPSFMFTMAPAMPHFLGEYGARSGRLPYRTLLDQGWRLPAGSDCTPNYDIEASDPFTSMWCAMAREGWDGVPIEPEESIDLESALRMHTQYPAELLGEGDRKGTLEAGKLADLVVLDRDITAGVDAATIRDVQVDHVLLGGRTVYSRPGAEPLAEKTL